MKAMSLVLIVAAVMAAGRRVRDVLLRHTRSGTAAPRDAGPSVDGRAYRDEVGGPAPDRSSVERHRGRDGDDPGEIDRDAYVAAVRPVPDGVPSIREGLDPRTWLACTTGDRLRLGSRALRGDGWTAAVADLLFPAAPEWARERRPARREPARARRARESAETCAAVGEEFGTSPNSTFSAARADRTSVAAAQAVVKVIVSSTGTGPAPVRVIVIGAELPRVEIEIPPARNPRRAATVVLQMLAGPAEEAPCPPPPRRLLRRAVWCACLAAAVAVVVGALFFGRIFDVGMWGDVSDVLSLFVAVLALMIQTWPR